MSVQFLGTMRAFFNVVLMAFAVMTIDAQAADAPPLWLMQTIALPNVEERVDHMAVEAGK